MSDANAPAMTLETRQVLNDLRNQLLKLHKAIMDTEKAGYEKVNGRIESPHAFLQLLMKDPWFGWFRPISEMVVQIDELLDSKEPVPEHQAQEVLREARSLMRPSEEGEEFGVKLRAILQDNPDIILMHAQVQQTLQ